MTVHLIQRHFNTVLDGYGDRASSGIDPICGQWNAFGAPSHEKNAIDPGFC